MDLTPLIQLLPIVVLVWVIVHLRTPPSFWQRLDADFRRLMDELDHGFRRGGWLRVRVFSAETIHRREAEFIRERLRRKLPYGRLLVALLAVGVLLWWLAR